MVGAEMVGPEMGGAEMVGAEMGGAEMGGAEMSGAEMGGAEMSRAEMEIYRSDCLSREGHACYRVQWCGIVMSHYLLFQVTVDFLSFTAATPRPKGMYLYRHLLYDINNIINDNAKCGVCKDADQTMSHTLIACRNLRPTEYV